METDGANDGKTSSAGAKYLSPARKSGVRGAREITRPRGAIAVIKQTWGRGGFQNCWAESVQDGRQEMAAMAKMAKMAKKKKQDRFNPVKEIKAMARERIGIPPVEKVVPDRKKKEKRTEKHPKTLAELLEERDQNG